VSTTDKTLTIECTKTYDCQDPVLGLPWAPGAKLTLPEGVAKKILKLSPHSFREALEDNPALPGEVTEETKKEVKKEQEVK
jgi:hypothetical protein